MGAKLHEDRAGVWSQMEELIKAGAETWDADSTTKYENLESEYRSLTTKIEAEERFAALNKPQGPPIPPQTTEDAETEQRNAAYTDAFVSYLRGGEARLSTEQRALLLPVEDRALSSQIGSQGGYLVPEGMRASIIEALKLFGGIRPLAEILPTDQGNDLLWPANDDTANEGEIIAENTTATEQDTAFTAIRLGAHIFSSKYVKVPNSLLQDSAVPLDTYLGRKFGERIGRIQAKKFIHGTGSGEPQGIVFGRDTAKDVDTTAAVTFDNLQDLIVKVDPAYRQLPGTGFVMNDTVAAAIRKIKTGISGDLQTIWQPSMQLGTPDRLLGWPVTIDQAMDADAATGGGSGATGKPVLFGNVREAYIIRDVLSVAVARLAELFALLFQTAFIGFARSDAGVKNTAAYACIERTS